LWCTGGVRRIISPLLCGDSCCLFTNTVLFIYKRIRCHSACIQRITFYSYSFVLDAFTTNAFTTNLCIHMHSVHSVLDVFYHDRIQSSILFKIIRMHSAVDSIQRSWSLMHSGGWMHTACIHLFRSECIQLRRYSRVFVTMQSRIRHEYVQSRIH